MSVKGWLSAKAVSVRHTIRMVGFHIRGEHALALHEFVARERQKNIRATKWYEGYSAFLEGVADFSEGLAIGFRASAAMMRRLPETVDRSLDEIEERADEAQTLQEALRLKISIPFRHGVREAHRENKVELDDEPDYEAWAKRTGWDKIVA